MTMAKTRSTAAPKKKREGRKPKGAKVPPVTEKLSKVSSVCAWASQLMEKK